MTNFDPAELLTEAFFPTVGEYYGYGPDYAIMSPKYQFPVSPKENFELFRSHKPYYWVPSLTNDFNLICPDIVPDFPACGLMGGIDSFGVTWIPTRPEEFLPSFVKPGNPMLEDIADWESVVHFPDVSSWDWEGSGKLYMEGLDLSRPNCGIMLSGFFERSQPVNSFDSTRSRMIDMEENKWL